jgi:hypothetical protein
VVSLGEKAQTTFLASYEAKSANLLHHFKMLLGIFSSREQGIFSKGAGNFLGQPALLTQSSVAKSSVQR